MHPALGRAATVGTLLAALRWLGPHLILRGLNRRIEAVGLHGGVETVRLDLGRRRLILKNLRLAADEGVVRHASADEIVISWRVRDLLRGRLEADCRLIRPRLHLLPAPRQDQARLGPALRRELSNGFTFHLRRTDVEDGSLLIAPTASFPLELSMTGIGGSVANLTNAPRRDRTARGALRGSLFDAAIRMDVRLDPWAQSPDLELDAGVLGLELARINPLLERFGYFKAERGTLSIQARVTAKDGGFSGVVRPRLHGLRAARHGEPPRAGNFVDTVVRGVVALLSASGEELGVDVPIYGRFEDPHTSVWRALGGLLLDGLVRAVLPSAVQTRRGAGTSSASS